MTSDLHLSPELTLPIDYMTLATVVYGARGSGKTNLGVVVGEELDRAGQRFCAIDLKGDWWGMKSAADGESPGIPVVIFGGEHADVPLEDGSGAVVGQIVAEIDQSVVIDLEHFSKGRQIRWLKDFFAALYHHNRTPLLVIADEVQRYAPQRPMSPDETMCLAAVEDLIKLGRKHGLGIVCLTQRGAGLNKEVSELCDVLVAMRTPGPIDQERIKDWLDANATREQRDQVMGMLAKLPTGTAVFASGHPDIDLFKVVPIRHRWTYDSSATPKVGEIKREPKVLADVDLEQLRTRMAETIERAKEDDPKELRARIQEHARDQDELKQRLERAEQAMSILEQKATERIEVPVISDEMIKRIESIADSMVAQGMKQIDAAGELRAALVAARPLANVPAIVPEPEPQPAQIGKLTQPRKRQSATAQASQVKIDGSQQRVLNALATYESFGQEQASRAGVAALAGYKQGGRYNTVVSSLSTAGLVFYPDAGLVALTEEGRARAVGLDIRTATDVVDAWLNLCDGSQQRVLNALIVAYPVALSREELAEQSGYVPGGRFNTVVSSLHTMAAVNYPSKGYVRASPLLFPEGLR